MREHVKAQEPFTREDVTVDAALERFRARGPALQGRADRGPGPRRGRRHRLALHERAVHRPLPRPARADHRAGSRRSSCSRSPARTGAATRSARCSPASTAPRSTRPRSSTRTSSGSSRRARATTASSAASSTCSCSPSSRPGSPFWQPDGMVVLERADRPVAARRTPRAATARSRRRSSTTPSCSRCPGHWDVYRDNMYFTEVEDRTHGPQAHELPGAHPALQGRAPLLPRPADPLLRGRARPPPRAERHAARAAARPPHHPGRRPHLLHRGADRRRGQPLPGLRLRDLRHVRLRAAAGALDPAGEADRHRGHVGPRRGGARGRAASSAASSSTSTPATARSTGRRSTCT